MCIKRVIKNLSFIILMGVIFVFSGMRVDAATCEYVFKYDFPMSTPWTDEVHLSLTVDNASSLLKNPIAFGIVQKTELAEDGSYTKVEGEEPISVRRFSSSMQLDESTNCPVLYLYANGSGADWQLIASESECELQNGKCNEDFLSSSSGVLTVAEGEEQPILNCSSEKAEEFEKKTAYIFVEIDDLYQKYLDLIPEVGGNISDDDAQKNMNGLLSAFNSSIISRINKVRVYANEYNCDTVYQKQLEINEKINTKADSYRDSFVKIWDFRLETEKKSRQNRGDTEGAKSIENLQQITGEKVQDSKNWLNDQIARIDEPLKLQLGELIDASCEEILGDVLDLIQKAFNIIKIVAPILLIFFGSLDFAKAVIASDDKAMKKATSDFMKRAIAAVLIFFIPFFIELIFNMPGIELGIENILCGIGKVVLK